MRDKTIDGYRAVAALGVVFCHAVTYRLGNFQQLHYAQRLAGPLAQTSVQIFFVISGYIITSLLVQERDSTGAISVRAFYARRIFRIVPPLALVLLTVGAMGEDPTNLLFASTFTCNLAQCNWPVAHTWSLSAEEQFYVVWPMLLVSVNPKPRTVILTISGLSLAFLIAPFAWHSNYISFACIGMGALYALSHHLRRSVTELSNPIAWLGTVILLLLMPLYLPFKAQVMTPALIVYLLFATPAFVRKILATRPVQIVGTASYSLYLWQQLFLGAHDNLPLWALPIVVALSVLLVERPFIKLGRRLSVALGALRTREV